jgi:hypothetical protein
MMARGELEEGYTLWRSQLAGGLRGTAGPRGSWESGTGGGAPVAGTLLGALVHGILGFAPDAPSGRLELRPAFAARFRAFAVSALAMGDFRFTLAYRRSGPCATYTITPTGGRVPPTLVLAPTVTGREVRATRVDGVPADLDWRARDGGVETRVQLPLDRERTLEVETG